MSTITVKPHAARLLLDAVRRDPILFAAALLALVSLFFVPPSAAYLDYIDFRTLALLLSLMLVVAGGQSCGAFELIVARLLGLVHTARALASVLVLVCFFSSMCITNDVALITFVPLAILLLTRTAQTKLLIPVIVLQTIAANLGSMLTPLGNPQNLYLYSLSGMSILPFLRTMALPSGLSLAMLAGALLCIKPLPLCAGAADAREAPQWGKIALWCALFALCLMTVLHIVHYAAALAAVVIAVLIAQPKLLVKADYALLLTFVFFFIFIGNMKAIPLISQGLSGLVAGHELTLGILLSQVISNVPAAMLLGSFTHAYEPLLLGVNIGGLGTLIASMASMISYKFYAKTPGAHTGRYLLVFTGANILFLAILWLSVLLFA